MGAFDGRNRLARVEELLASTEAQVASLIHARDAARAEVERMKAEAKGAESCSNIYRACYLTMQKQLSEHMTPDLKLATERAERAEADYERLVRERDAARAEVDDIRRASFSSDVYLRGVNKTLRAEIERLKDECLELKGHQFAAESQVAALREALGKTTELLNCGPPDEDGSCGSHTCSNCDDYVDRNAVQRIANVKLFASTAQAAADFTARVRAEAIEEAIKYSESHNGWCDCHVDMRALLGGSTSKPTAVKP